VATFDQDIDRQAILKLLTLTQANNQNNKIGLRLVADAIALSDKSLKDVFEPALKRSMVSF
jgi:Holliday junction resolvasome RuvABC ATP-dependent DNA helicase subunit